MGDITSNKNQKKERYVSALLVLNGISQSKLAEKIGATQQHFSRVVLGQRGGTRKPGPMADLIRQTVAQSLGMAVSELWSPKRSIFKVAPILHEKQGIATSKVKGEVDNGDDAALIATQR